MIEIHRLRVQYGARTVLDDLSWVFPSGTYTLIKAPNGVGKSALLRSTLGLEGRSGTVRFDGQELHAVRNQVNAVLEPCPRYPQLSGRQNLMALGQYSGAEDLLSRLELHPTLMRRKVKHYSAGEGKRLALAMCLASSPRFVFLDEIDSGLDEHFRSVVQEILAELKDSITLVMTGHWGEFYEVIADQVVTLSNGKLRE